MKFKKVAAVAASAAICCTMVSGLAVSAEEATAAEGTSVVAEMNASDPVWTECKKMAGAKYSSTNVKLAEKYSKKKATKSVSYGKSRTKKFLDKYYASLTSEDPSFGISMINKNTVIASAVKDKKVMTVMYMEAEGQKVGLGIFQDEKNMTMLDPTTKTKMVMPITGDGASSASAADVSAALPQLNIEDSAKGKIFKFKSNDKSYVYEEFESPDYGKLGILFDSNNRPIVMLDETGTYCVSVTYSPKDSVFKVPSGYTEMDMG